jgi:hypothetical protein
VIAWARAVNKLYVYQTGDQGSVPGKYISLYVSSYKSYLDPTSFVFDGYLGHMNVQMPEHKVEYALNSVEYTFIIYYLRAPIRPLDIRHNCRITLKFVVCVCSIYTHILSRQYHI